jgi:hypothetical protein
MPSILWLLVILLLLAWVGGFALNLGSLIHVLLVVALLVALFNLFSGRRVSSGL